MSKNRRYSPKIDRNKINYSAIFFLVIGILTIVFIINFCFIQGRSQEEIKSLGKKIEELSTEIQGSNSKEKLSLKKDLLSIQKDKVNIINSFYNNTLQAFTGFFFVITAFFTWYNSNISNKTLEVAEEKQISERFAKAVELLGSNIGAVRTGAIYSLEKIAQDSEIDYWAIMEVLAFFVKESSLKLRDNKIDHVGSDIQSALIVISRLTHEKYSDQRTLDVSGAYLPHVNLENMNLRLLNLKGVNLRESNLDNANLEAVELQDADLSMAYLGKVNFKNANLDRVKLQNVNTGSRTVEKANFSRTSLHNSDFSGAILSLSDFSDAELCGAKLNNAIFFQADFSRANLSNTLLINTIFKLSNLTDAKLAAANVLGANFIGAKNLTKTQKESMNNWSDASNEG
jgi:uncharacterized protein YjbI with pentapeptide repeats